MSKTSKEKLSVFRADVLNDSRPRGPAASVEHDRIVANISLEVGPHWVPLVKGLASRRINHGQEGDEHGKKQTTKRHR